MLQSGKDWGYRSDLAVLGAVMTLSQSEPPEFSQEFWSEFGQSQSSTCDPDDSEWVLPNHEVKKILVDAFKQVPQVKSICVRFGSDEVAIWTLLESYDRDARQQVYEKELELCTMLKVRDFDFRVTSVDLVSPAELVRAGSLEIYRRN